ncbi:hypothetical protein ACJX0J_016509, partial [Zea mays]
LQLFPLHHFAPEALHIIILGGNIPFPMQVTGSCIKSLDPVPDMLLLRYPHYRIQNHGGIYMDFSDSRAILIVLMQIPIMGCISRNSFGKNHPSITNFNGIMRSEMVMNILRML